MHLDALDRALLELLAADARLPTTTIARRLGLSRTTVQSRIVRLETGGVILGYTTRLGAQAPAPREPVAAFVLIAVVPRHAASVETALRRLEGVRTLHAVSGGFDLVALIETASLRDTDRLLDRIGSVTGVERTNSMLILSSRPVPGVPPAA